jgi:hypothetical protein
MNVDGWGAGVRPSSAVPHSLLGDRADHDQLRAWARSMQALAFRFTKDFERSRDAAADGLKYISSSRHSASRRMMYASAPLAR